jgi:hypothetical protein
LVFVHVMMRSAAAWGVSMKWWGALLGAACSASPGLAATGTDEEALANLHQQIVTLVGEPRCENIVHCRVLALGSRPCGGPAEYVAYSSITGNRELLEAKAYEYGFLQEEVNRAHGAAGACDALAQPRVACVNGRCTLNSDRR